VRLSCTPPPVDNLMVPRREKRSERTVDDKRFKKGVPLIRLRTLWKLHENIVNRRSHLFSAPFGWPLCAPVVALIRLIIPAPHSIGQRS